ncbi:MAG: hypothetical protein WA160_06135 [Pseudobdellovibrio sp.]
MSIKPISRRSFLFNSGKSLATLLTASVGIYAIGSAHKALDGSMVAGAKAGTWVYQSGPTCNTGDGQQSLSGTCNIGDIGLDVTNDFGGGCGLTITYVYTCQ